MSIQMIGIDHSLAEVEVRELFSFTKSQAVALMEKWKKQRGIHGIVLLSTCNRLEIYVNQEAENLNYCGMICAEKGVEEVQYRRFFCIRDGQEAVRHLFEMTAGLHSLIIGEDQILSQVKDALSFSREHYMADKVLEVLFRQAITVAKEIKTRAPFPRVNISAADEAIESLKKQGREFTGKKCLVIGNGVMGRLTAQVLLREQADVTVTVRQYHKGVVDIPAGAERIDYGSRYEILPDCDYVFSATSSPNLTVTKERLEKCGLKKEQVFVDLAVPRDMEPEVGKFPSVTLYDVDDFTLGISPEMQSGLALSSSFIEQGIEEFRNWYECRELVPLIQKIASLSAADVCGRLEKPFKEIEETERERLLAAVESSADKVIARMLFALRDELEVETFQECLEILENKFT